MHRVPTGSEPLDAALGGGLPEGASILVEGPQGVGSTEFALTLLRKVGVQASKEGVFATALRAPERAAREARDLFEEKGQSGVRFVAIRPGQARLDCLEKLGELGRGDVLVVESTAALSRTESGRDLIALFQTLADAAHESGALVIHLHAPNTLPLDVETGIAEAADGILSFSWRDGGPTRRRVLTIPKLRGLAPALRGEQVPVFDAALHTGLGFTISRVHTVV